MINIQQNISLAPYTTFKIGGPARFFAEVQNEEELLEALNFAQKNNLEIFVLGGGSNILVSDEGFNGLVIKIIASLESLKCWAGNNLSEVVKLAKEHSLTGLEWAAGIPGTIGGAIRGNAGAYNFDMSGVVEEIKVIEIQELKIKTFNNKDCKFSYRSSIFKENKNLIMVSAILKLQKGDKAEIENKIKEILKKRSEKIPQGQSAGSFFQNPIVDNPELIKRFEKDTGIACKDNKIPAGWLIEEVGLKGKKIGGAMVNEEHGNFVINKGSAKAQDVIILASLIKQQVRDKFGVELKEEVQYVGF